MATWPSGSKASTTNLDAGTDSPATARADLKQNTDNVNSIIDMFNISSPSNNQILKYNTSNTRFELATDDGLLNVVEDTTPQLGGDLDVNGQSIVSTANGDISLTPNGTGLVIVDSNLDITNGNIVTGSLNGNLTLTPNGTGKVIIAGDLQVDGITTTVNSTTVDIDDINITLAKGAANAAAANGGGITLEGPTTAATITYASSDDSWNFNKKTSVPLLVVDNINIDGNTISSTDANGNITVTPNGTGSIVLDGQNWPQADGSPNAFLKTNGSGQLSYATITQATGAELENIVEDTTPQLGGALDVNGQKIVSTSNGNIELEPNGTGDVYLTADTVRVGDSNANATITTNGTGDLILNTNSGTNSGTITIQDAANGNIVLAPNGTGRVQISGTSSNAGGIEFYEDTDNGTNKALVTAPAALGADVTLTLPATTATLGYQNLPAVGTQTGSYSLGTGDVGKYVQVGSGGSITIPNNTFAEGDVIVVINNHTAAITITCTITDAYIAGTDSDKASVSLATRGIATIVFLSATRCIISGNVT